MEGFTIADYFTLSGYAFVWTGLWAAVYGRPELALTMLMIAMIADGLDGKLARVLGVARSFGKYMGSFVDMVNYVVCPPLILHAMGYDRWWCLIFLFAYSILGLFRLSRFNEIGNVKDDKGQIAYLGLPAAWIHPIVVLLYALKATAGETAFMAVTGPAIVLLGGCYLFRRVFWKPKSYVTILAIPVLLFSILYGVMYLKGTELV
jgi:CDP-diacylglycerol---serine O-phosphatidyltransferase